MTEITDNRKENDEIRFDYYTNASWRTTLFLGLQHFLAMSIPSAAGSLIVMNHMCLEDDSPIKSEMVSVNFFVMGICTLLQTIIGCRLPIIQGATYTLILPIVTLLNDAEMKTCNITNNKYIQEYFSNSTAPDSMFTFKIRLISGSILVASLIEILVAASGLLFIFKILISPLSLAAIYAVLTLSICNYVINMIAEQWLTGIMSLILMVIMSVFLPTKEVPIPFWSKNSGFNIIKLRIFQICPVILSLIIMWIFCGIFTVSNVFSKDPNRWGYAARIDTKLKAIYNAPIIKIPYPMQWGLPLVKASAIVALSAGIIMSIIESVGDYIVTAEIINAPSVPKFVINRGIFVEGIGVFLSGLLCSVAAPTSYSGNIGLMKITKAGNNLIAQVAAFFMILCGIFPMIGSLIVSTPNSVIGGIVFIMGVMILSCTLNNLRVIEFYSSRNCFIFGSSVSIGLFLPVIVEKNASSFSIGYKPIDEVVLIVLSFNLLITAVLSIFLDNIIPGKQTYRQVMKSIEISSIPFTTKPRMTELEIAKIYDIRLFRYLVIKFPMLQYIPLFPAYKKLGIEG